MKFNKYYPNDLKIDIRSKNTFIKPNKHKFFTNIFDIIKKIIIFLFRIFKSGMENMAQVRLKSKYLKLSILFITCFVLLSFYYFGNQKNLNTTQFDNIIYSIVIDAGSTGSRIHVFKLDHPNSNNLKKFDIKLVNEDLLIKVNPGLSSFAKSPENAWESIKPLIEKATNVIPAKYHKMTRLSLKATAGLRMVSEEIANKILNNIREMFKNYPFITKNEDVSIIDGKHEGIYSWITLNYALNYYDEKKESSVCALDMGGGSTQVTYVPSKIDDTNFQDVVDFNVDEMNYKIYSKSFLGFGLMSARMNIFRLDTINLLKNSTDKNDNKLFSVCMPAKHQSKWIQQEIEYSVHGPDNNEQHSFEKCYKNVIKTIQNSLKAPDELNNKEIYAFSFYHDRLKMANAFGSYANGGKLKIETIKQKAKSVCDSPESSENADIDKAHKDYSFLCMDLTFIYAILSQGYTLPDHKEINIYNQVNEMEISWALGAAFHMLNDQS